MISSAEQITPSWLTMILREKGILKRGHVREVLVHRKKQEEMGPGYDPENRLAVKYSTDASENVPPGFYLKMGSGLLHPEAGQREIDFYQNIASTMSYLPAPVCYATGSDPSNGAYFLLLEDCSDSHRSIHPETPHSSQDTRQMLNALARLHAFWWGKAAFDPRIPDFQSSEALQNSFLRLETHFSGYMDFLGDQITSNQRKVYENAIENYPIILTKRLTSRESLTLVHHDAHSGNFLLPRLIQPGNVYLVDWQQWGLNIAMLDVAYLIALFWEPNRRNRLENRMVRFYHDRLIEYGVKGYDWQSCWQDYRLMIIEILFVPFWAWVFEGKNWGQHRWGQSQKALTAYRDLGCADILAG